MTAEKSMTFCPNCSSPVTTQDTERLQSELKKAQALLDKSRESAERIQVLIRKVRMDYHTHVEEAAIEELVGELLTTLQR